MGSFRTPNLLNPVLNFNTLRFSHIQTWRNPESELWKLCDRDLLEIWSVPIKKVATFNPGRLTRNNHRRNPICNVYMHIHLVRKLHKVSTRIVYIPVVPGQAGGGSFQKEKNYIAQKEFAYRMCARRPTSAMPKSFLCCERAFCRSMVVMFCALKWSVLMSWCLLRGQVMWWSRHLMRCNGLCCVMSRDAMRCHGDELYYSRTTLYYKVLLQYYSVLQSTTPILPWTTKYHSSTTLYYKVLLQYYSVLQILLCRLQY